MARRRGLGGAWRTLTDALAPAGAVRDFERLRRTRIAVGASVISIALGSVFAVRLYFLVDESARLWVSGATLGLSVASLGTLGLMKLTGRVMLPVHLGLGYALVYVSFSAYALDGGRGPGLFWLAVFPAVALFTGSPRSGLIYLALCEAICVGFAFGLGSESRPLLVAEGARAELWLSSVSGLLITLFALVLVVDRAKDRTLEHLRRIQRALVRARDQAAEASQSKSDFLARVSHEVRTPMTAILGFSELLLERLRRADPMRESVTTIRRNARHLLDVINDILDLSRIEDDRLDIVERDCDPGAIAREVIHSLQMRARESDVSLDVQLEPVVPQRIRADPRRLRQVLLCLVGNAIKFSGGGTVWVRLSCTDCGSEPRLCFEIRDAGIGMLPEQLDRLFEPFVQGDSSARRRFGGTGLGLSIAKRLCERMGGSIEARSELGVGSRFCVVLPLEPPGADAASAEVEADPGEASIPALDGGPRVLFADDVRDNRRLLGEVLERAGARATLCEDGRAALEAAREQRFDVVVLDLEMPGLSGLEVARALRAQGYSGPLIALTARALHGAEERQLETCFDVVVAKPFERRDLLGAIAQARQRRGAAGVREAPARPARRAAQARGGRWERWVRGFVPPGLREDPAELYRARIVVGLGLVPIPVMLGWAALLPVILRPPMGEAFAALLVLAALMVLVIPWLLRRFGSLTIAGHALLGYSFAFVALLTGFTGGVGSPVSYWVTILVTAGAPLVGLRGTGVWAVCGLGLFGAFYALDRAGLSPQSWLLPQYGLWVNTGGAATLTALTSAVMLLFARSQRATIDTLQAANQQLREARRRADQGSRSKSEFIANVSHEIRTPLTAILGFAELVEDESGRDDAHPELRHAVDIIGRNGAHLLSLIDGLLDLSRIEAGRVELQQVAFDPAGLCREAVELLRVRAQERGLDLGMRVTDPVPAFVGGDPTRVRQVLINLLGNAIKFTEAGSVELRVRAATGRLCFEVEDTGVGMSPEDQARVFEAFVQSAGTRGGTEPGTGLGLAIARFLCELMGGSISVESRVGEGSCFRFEIRASEVCAPRAQPESAERPEPGSLEGTRVLLVEDGPDNQQLIRRVLGRVGAQVTVASDGRAGLEAVELAEERGCSFDVVLMDMQMPVLDGHGAVRELRRRGCHLPVIALTAHAFEEERVRCLEAGCDAFTTKPIDRPELLRLVAHYHALRKLDEEGAGIGG